MSAPETIADVTAEMRRLMPHGCGDWADRIDRASRSSAVTLRDHFAGQWLAGIAGSGARFGGREVMATTAYAIADAFVAQRDKTLP